MFDDFIGNNPTHLNFEAQYDVLKLALNLLDLCFTIASYVLEFGFRYAFSLNIEFHFIIAYFWLTFRLFLA